MPPAVREAPPGVSAAAVLCCLAEQAATAGAHRLARSAHQRLQRLRLPPSEQERADLAAVLARAAPRTDAPGLLPVCFCCGAGGDPVPDHGGTTGPRAHTGDACAACGARYVRSFLTFESLPLVEFSLAPGISDAEAEELLREGPQAPPTSARQAGASATCLVDDGDDSLFVQASSQCAGMCGGLNAPLLIWA
ncbi:hypothetical protein WJX81_007354 [Elliptochloris bilobata]|uniref:Uncharacterized protein n=1 Tax=Elliptochloris bilobata TaxID=381761 RepID=A0AAW1QWU5_9CHLO